MFFHNLKYSLKCLFKNKGLIFWTFVFPIILGTFYKLAFSNIESAEKLDTVDIAVIESETSKIYTEVLNNIDTFNIKYTTLEDAKNLLRDGSIKGYVYFKESPNIVVKENGVDETILKLTIDEVTTQLNIYKDLSNKYSVEEIIIECYEQKQITFEDKTLYKVDNNKININDISSANLSYTLIEFYNLIAMAILYGGMLALYITNKRMPNISSVGKRTSVSPTKKSTMIFSSLLASYIVEVIGLLLLFIYTIFILNIDFGSRFSYIVLISLIGVLSALTFGVFLSTLKLSENAKTGILLSITMFWCFLAGMTGITMKYIIDKHVPILNIINPANMITDGLYSLYYYESLNRYYFNIISLIIFSLIMIVISIFSLRRKRYDSI